MKQAATAIYHFLQKRSQHSAQRLLARQCFACEKVSRVAVCASCRRNIRRPALVCRVCGMTMVGQGYDDCCRDCIQHPPAFSRLAYAGDYEGVLSKAIVAAKIGQHASALEAVGYLQRQYLADNCLGDYEGYSVLAMPIPRLRLMQRGFNLPHLLAKNMAKHYQLPLVPSDAVTLPWQSKKQARLSQKQRRKNIPTYRIHHRLPEHIVIVDDVVTTGQSVNTLAIALKNHGVKNIAVWALARTQWE